MTKKQLDTIIDSFDIEPALRTDNRYNYIFNNYNEQYLSEDKLDIKNCFFLAGIFLKQSMLEYDKEKYGKEKEKILTN